MTGSIALWLNSIPQRLNSKKTSARKPAKQKVINQNQSEIAFDISVAKDIRQALGNALTALQSSKSKQLNCTLYIVQRASNAIGFELHHAGENNPPLGLLNQLSYQLSAQSENDDSLRYKLPGSAGSVQIHQLNNKMSASSLQGWLVLFFRDELPSYDVILKEITPSIRTLEKGLCGWYQQQAKIEQAISTERATHAAELHDSMAQILGYMRIKSSRLATLCEGQADHAITEMSADLAIQANCAYRQARELIATSRLSLEEGSLIDAIIKAVEEFKQRSGIVFEIDNRVGLLLTTVDDIQALHIVREALCNIVRHSKASHARIVLFRQPDQTIKIRIEDNGTGIKDSQGRQDSFGLRIMQERAEKLAAGLYIVPRKNGGTRIDLHITETRK